MRKLFCVSVLAAALTLPATALGAAGDIYVADEDAATVFKVVGGQAQPLSASTDFADPSGMVMAPDGSLLVADYSAFTAGAIFRVDSRTGATTTFLAGGGEMVEPTDLAWGPDGQLYVTAYDPTNTTPRIVRVNPQTKAVTPVASSTLADWQSNASIAVARDGSIYFTDYDNEVFKLPPGGAVTPLVNGNPFAGADGIALAPDERTLYVADFGSPDGGCCAPPNSLIAVDLATNSPTIRAVTDDSVAVSLRPDRSFLISDTDDADDGLEGITTAPFGGSPVTFVSSADAFAYPHDTVQEPQRCGGRLPTVVGTTGKDVLRGSRFADVVLALGGKDTVRALGGKDIVCGGPGKDRLIGGAGKDRLLGQAGKDNLAGGKGRDTCKGGKGKDRGRACEAGKI